MRALVLFAGAGGACLGLRDAGIEHALSVEWDDDAASTSRAAGFPCVTGDVRDLSLYDDVGSVDLLWSSFPCQDFSSAGSRKGAKGDRNGWPWTVDVLDRLAARGNGPRWLLAENVTGLATHVGECPTRDGKPQDDPEACPRCYLERVIMPQLRARFTWADWRILDAADYGVWQRRRRVIIAAGPHPIAWPEATHSGEALAKAKWVTKDYWRAVGVAELGEPSAQESRWLKQRGQLGLFAAEPRRFCLRPWRTVRQALGLGGTLEASRNTDANPTQERPITTDEPIFAVGGKGNQYLTMERGRDGTGGGTHSERRSVDEPSVSISGASGGSTRPMLETRVLGGGRNPVTVDGVPVPGDARRLRDITDEPSTTVAAQTGGGAGNAGPFVESGQRRRLTVEECATLQDFPAGYPWQGAKTAQYRQVGNAVPPTLARVVAESVSKARLRAAMAGARKALTTGSAGFDLGER